MLSIENPPPDRPSCSSCKNSGLKGDERSVAAAAHDKLVLHEEEAAAAADLGTSSLAHDPPLPHFSIRDYVFNARSKDVGVNWPFPERFLQLCLKHGVRDILPPFEGPDSVRAQCSGKGVGPDKPTACVEVHETLAQGELVEKHAVDDDDDDDDDVKCLSSWQVNHLGLESSDRAQSQLSAEGTLVGKSCSNEAGVGGTTTSTITSHVRTDKISSRRSHQAHRSLNEISGSLEASAELEFADPQSTSKRTENSDRKCRLIVKLGGISESNRTEEILSNSSAASEAMASKVCPVCKTFSSTSNTTLNAHIDQCLAVESTSKRGVTDVTKHRVKPRKKRSMVDICATAPSCTLEDLDRRNGTNWALESRVLMPNGEVRSESKRQRLAQIDFADDGDDRAVYFDSNGTKLRILSKFNDSVAPTAGDDITPRKYLKYAKHGKSYFGGKKKRLTPKSSKPLKLKPQSKKLCSLKLSKDEICEVPHQKHRIENHEDKEKSLSQLLKSRDPVKLSSSGTLRQWACSKRTGLLRKASIRDECGRVTGDLATSANQNPLVETKRSTSKDSPADRSHILKFSRSSANASISVRSKRSEVVSSSVSIANNGERSSKPVGEHPDQLNESASIADDQMLNFSRIPENYSSSPGSKSVENDTFAVRMSSNPSEGQSFPLKAKKSITLRKNSLFGRPRSSMEASKCNETENSTLAFKKPWKEKLLVEGIEPSRDFPSDANEICTDTMRNFSRTVRPNYLSLNKVTKIRKLDILNDMRFQGEESAGEASMERSIMLDSGHARDQCTISSVCRETASLRRLDTPAECQSPGLADMVDSLDEGRPHSSPSTDIHPSKSDGQESAAVSENADIDSFEKAVVVTVEMSSRAQSSYEDVQANGSCMQSPSLEDEYICAISQTETFEQHMEVDYDNPDMGCADEVGDEVTGLNSQMTGEADSRMEGDSLSDIQYPGFAADPPPIQGPGQCLPSTSDFGQDVLHDNASVTSGGPQFSQDEHRSIDLDPSRSPASPTSTISSPPNTRSDFNCPEPKSPPGFPSAEDKLSMNYTDCTSVPTNYHRLLSATNLGEERMVLERQNPKATVLSMKEFPKNYDDQPCCCSRKESTVQVASVSYQEPQLFRQRNFLAPVMLPGKTKQMISNSYVGQEISASRSCLSSRADESSVLEPSAGSGSTKAPFDNAVRLTNASDFESASTPCTPSQMHPHQPSSNSFFRLMGKDLMVMNKEEDDCMQLHRVPHLDAPSPNDHPNAKYLTLLGFSTGSAPNQDSISLYRQIPNGSAAYGNPCNPLQNFNIGFHNGFRNQSSSKVHLTALRPSEVHHKAMDLGGFVGPVLQPGRKGHKPDPQLQPKRNAMKTNSPFSYNVDSQISVSAAESTSSVPEVIVIDDSPDVEADLSKGNGRYVAASKGKQLPLMGIMPQTALNPNMKPVKSFSGLPLHTTFSRELPVGQKPSFLMSCPGANANSTKQGASEGSSIHSQSPFMLSSPPAGYLNSALYYSPSLR